MDIRSQLETKPCLLGHRDGDLVGLALFNNRRECRAAAQALANYTGTRHIVTWTDAGGRFHQVIHDPQEKGA